MSRNLKILTPDEEIIEEMMENVPRHRNILKCPETRKMEKMKLIWPAEINEKIKSGFVSGYLELANTEDIEQTANIYRKGFPELFGGVYEDLHFPRRYADLAEYMKILLLKDLENGRVASAWALSPSEKNMSVEFSLTVTDPEYRGRGLCMKFTEMVDKLVEESEAEQGYVYCAAFHTTTQNIFKNLGFEEVGKIEGFIKANVGMGRYARDSVVMLSKLYGNAKKLCPEKTYRI